MRCIPAVTCNGKIATYSYAEEVPYISQSLVTSNLETILEPSFVFKLFSSKSI